MPLFRLLLLLSTLSLLCACPGSPDDDDSASDDDDSVSDDDDSASDDDDSASDDDDSASDDDDSASDDDDDDDSSSGLRETALNALSATYEDSNGDGVWSQGEVLSITAAVANEGEYDHWMYPGFLLETTSPYVDLDSNELFVFFGMLAGETVEAYWQVTALEDTPTPQDVEFSITGSLMDPTQACGGEGKFEPPCVTSTPLLFSATIE